MILKETLIYRFDNLRQPVKHCFQNQLSRSPSNKQSKPNLHTLSFTLLRFLSQKKKKNLTEKFPISTLLDRTLKLLQTPFSRIFSDFTIHFLGRKKVQRETGSVDINVSAFCPCDCEEGLKTTQFQDSNLLTFLEALVFPQCATESQPFEALRKLILNVY